ncbi:hypothetical protein FRC09_004753 [Ceratobasidium sp. 395]|nr:hypothetical protein FRC09_004753 [Ceratobasidium sp. 395]
MQPTFPAAVAATIIDVPNVVLPGPLRLRVPAPRLVPIPMSILPAANDILMEEEHGEGEDAQVTMAERSYSTYENWDHPATKHRSAEAEKLATLASVAPPVLMAIPMAIPPAANLPCSHLACRRDYYAYPASLAVHSSPYSSYGSHLAHFCTLISIIVFGLLRSSRSVALSPSLASILVIALKPVRFSSVKSANLSNSLGIQLWVT